MRNFINRTITFLLYAVIFYLVIVILTGLIVPLRVTKNLKYRIGSNGFLNTRIKELKNYGETDLLIVGSSRTYRGFDPRIFEQYGIRSFSLGSSAQTPMQTNILLKRYFDLIDPELVIFEVSPENLSSDGVESALDLIANDKNDLYTVSMALKLNNIKVYNTLIYGIFRDLFDLNKNFKEQPNREGDTYVSGGFVENHLIGDPESRNFESEIYFRDYQKSEFLKILDFLKAKEVPVILVRVPVTKYRYTKVINNLEIDNYFRSSGIYINGMDIVHLSDSLDFSDSHHMNQTGVEKFNRSLIDHLYQNNLLR